MAYPEAPPDAVLLGDATSVPEIDTVDAALRNRYAQLVNAATIAIEWAKVTRLEHDASLGAKADASVREQAAKIGLTAFKTFHPEVIGIDGDQTSS